MRKFRSYDGNAIIYFNPDKITSLTVVQNDNNASFEGYVRVTLEGMDAHMLHLDHLNFLLLHLGIKE